ncbi:MAG: hypothetical protein EA397_04780 [Deltaproteobacteria bacterium]|nr:MAG: hypothetical protein EA397_04780 [Deltaproteobacteria bacterium]
MDAITLVRSALPPEQAHHLDEALARFPRPDGEGRLSPDHIAYLVEVGALRLSTLVETVSDAPVVPGLPQRPDASVRYAPVALLGEGAMGQVFLVHDTALQRHVAVKVLTPDYASDRTMQRRFHHEVQITAQLDHPCIVPVYDLATDAEEGPSYAMKLVRGQTLMDLLGEAIEDPSRVPPLADRLSIFLDVCDAIAYAHRRGIIHRDLKPENIMVGAFNQVLVMDWGIAKRIGAPEALAPSPSEGESKAHKTQIGVAIGTPAYMSPEQARGENDTLDGQSDQYTLGLILQELVTLQRARQGSTSVHTLYMAMEGEKAEITPRRRPTNVPRELVAVIDKAAAPRAEDRYDSVQDLADDVRRFLRDEPVQAKPDTLLQSVGRTVARHRTLTVALVLLLLLGVVMIALIGVAGAVAVNEINRSQAERREQRLGELQRLVTDQAQRIESEFLTFEGHLQAIAGAAEQALLSPPPSVPFYPTHAFADPALAPPDTAPSAVYGDDVSLDHPDLLVATGLSLDEHQDEARRLASLTRVLRRAVFSSLSDETRQLPLADQEVNVRERPSPIVWSYVATTSGVMAGYPGTGDYPEVYEPRDRPWYLSAIEAEAPVWSALDADEGGLGLLITGASPLRDLEGEALGVAAIDVTFSHVIDTLLDPRGLDGVEAWLIDGEGHVIVRSSQTEQARDAPDDWSPPPFPHPDLLAILRTREGGTLTHPIDDTLHLAIWRPVPKVGWTYLITGPSEDLLDP